MADKRDEMVEIDAIVGSRNRHAVRVGDAWLPLEHIKLESHGAHTDSHTIMMPRWLCEEKGLEAHIK